jgi:hypothetical protein
MGRQCCRAFDASVPSHVMLGTEDSLGGASPIPEADGFVQGLCVGSARRFS